MLPNTSGDTPLLAASGLGIEKPGESPGLPEEVDQAVKLCLELGADATTVDAAGNTALHGAAVWGANGAVEALVAAGAKLDLKNKKGQTPWRIAEGAQFEDAVLAQPRDGRAASPADGGAWSESRVAGFRRNNLAHLSRGGSR